MPSAESESAKRSGSAPLRLARGRLVTIQGDARDRSVLEPLQASGGDWETHLRRLFGRLVEPDWVCLDLGANIGAHTLSLATLGAHVVAFEANPASYEHLVANVSAAGLGGKVTLVAEAVWDRTGELVLVDAVEYTGTAYVSAADESEAGNRHPYLVRDESLDYSTERRAVHAVRLDDWLPTQRLDRLDLVKIDVEGAEEIALAGALHTLARYRPFLVTEYNPDCAQALFGARVDAYYRFLADVFASIDVIGADSSLSRVREWSDLASAVDAGPGWVDLLCAPRPRPNNAGYVSAKRVGSSSSSSEPLYS